MATVADVARILGEFAPLHRAAEWDNVGLLLGHYNAKVERVLTCLTITPDVVAEAIAWRADLIVTHHPLLFRAVKRITDATAEGKLLLDLLRANAAVYCPHTAFDDCAGGINDQLAQRLKLQDVRPLRPWQGEKKVKLVVFVPDQDLSGVSDAIFAAGAGIIGQYSQCSFRLAGTGTFFGGQDANPTVGQKGRREEVNEWRLEAVCAESFVDAVVAAMRKAHSYEEPAYDVYSLIVPPIMMSGSGRIGRLSAPTSLEMLASTVRRELACGPIQVVGQGMKQVETVAIACGSGASFVEDVARAGADAFLTGEAKFHDYLKALSLGVSMILPGHYATERLGVEMLAEYLTSQCPHVQVIASQKESCPVSWA